MAFPSLLLALLLSTTPLLAGLYHCDSPDGSPEKVAETSPPEVRIHFTEPYFRPEAIAKEIWGRVPFLLYYAVDTPEPFMKIAVNHEVTELRNRCGREAINFFIVLNSKFIESRSFFVCKDQKFSEVSLSAFPEVEKRLETKLSYIRTGDHTLEDKGPMEFPVSFEKSVNEAFARYPLAHPDFLYEFMDLATSEKLFSAPMYIPFLNLKSHGSRNFVLSGLHSCQEKSKVDAQTEFLNNSSQETLGQWNLGQWNLGQWNLGQWNLGAIAGLGEIQGLGAEFAFGTYHLALNAVLRRFSDHRGKIVGFVMLESCDTQRDPTFHNTQLDRTLGFYSANYSLWYRNLDWWDLLSEAKGSSWKLLQVLDEKTRLIPNLELIRK